MLAHKLGDTAGVVFAGPKQATATFMSVFRPGANPHRFRYKESGVYVPIHVPGSRVQVFKTFYL